MANNKPRILELSPHLKERILKSILALIGFTLGVIAVVGALVVEFLSDIVKFVTLFIGALFIFFSLWRILVIATVKLYVNSEEICYRDRFIWKRISWSEVISIGRENEIEARNDRGALKRIKSLLILTNEGLKQFDMSSYSLAHGIETVDKVTETHPKHIVSDEVVEEEIDEET